MEVNTEGIISYKAKSREYIRNNFKEGRYIEATVILHNEIDMFLRLCLGRFTKTSKESKYESFSEDELKEMWRLKNTRDLMSYCFLLGGINKTTLNNLIRFNKFRNHLSHKIMLGKSITKSEAEENFKCGLSALDSLIKFVFN
jgi:hypothetical protein